MIDKEKQKIWKMRLTFGERKFFWKRVDMERISKIIATLEVSDYKINKRGYKKNN